MPRFFILFTIPITIDFLPFFCAFVFHSSWTNEVFPSRYTNTTHTPHFGHESRTAFPASLSHTRTHTHTHTSPEDASEIIGPSQNSVLWSCTHSLLPSPSRMRAWYQTRQEGNSLNCWIISSSFSKHFSPLHFLGCAWHTLNSLRPHAMDLFLLAVAISTLARNPSLPHIRFFNYDLQLLILNS